MKKEIQISPDFIVDDVETLLLNKRKPFYLKDYKGKSFDITFEKLSLMTFGTVCDIIANKKLYVAKSNTVDKVIKRKTTFVKEVSNNIIKEAKSIPQVEGRINISDLWDK